MRFLENGPNIPDELLWDRDEGNVVFLCGAGISIPSGLPSFWELTKYVIDKIGPSFDSDIAKAFAPWNDDRPKNEQIPVTARVPLDQIFNLLNDSIGKENVDRHVFDKLSSKSTTKKSIEHENLARLSSNTEGKPQLVTTNFDRLFDSVLTQRNVRNFVPPMFPNLEHSGVDATGITYLHGRLSDNASDQHAFVLSSSDFGRAYLAEAWATNFIRNLLQRYTVVLVGYSAEDPPVKYLLQGLASSRINDETKLYAFDRGTEKEVKAKWKDRGVKTIAYSGVGNDHAALWDTLSCWADRADSAIDWQKSVLELAQSDPKILKPHERGMVTHLVSSAVGARDFAKYSPSPPAEWLCVFDVNCRYAEPYKAKSYGIELDNDDIEPLDLYGLDDDPRRPDKGKDVISWLKEDGSVDSVQRLSGGINHASQMITPRLKHLSEWICKQIDSPILTWWIARQLVIHESLKASLSYEIGRSEEMRPALRKVWDILFEGLKSSGNYLRDYGWFEFQRRLKQDGWTQKTVWELELFLTPHILLNQPMGKQKSVPVIECLIDDFTIQDIANVEVSFPRLYDEKIEVDSDSLFKVTSIVQRSLIKLLETLDWVDTTLWNELTIYKDNNHDFIGSGEIEDLLSWFIKLFDQLIDAAPRKARMLVVQWPDNDVILFNKLQLYALSQVVLYSQKEVVEYLLRMTSELFWDLDHRNELLFLLRDRMNAFSKEESDSICERLFECRKAYHSDTEEEYELWKYDRAVETVEWLRQAGVSLSEEAEVRLDELKSALPEWRDESAKSAIKSSEDSKSGWMNINEDCEILLNGPVSNVVQLAINNTKSDFFEGKENAPFIGLVKTNPYRAFLALEYASREGSYPSQLWNTLFLHWPVQDDSQYILLLGGIVSHLPTELLMDIRQPVAIWIELNLKKMYLLDTKIAFKCLDGFIAALKEAGEVSTSNLLQDLSPVRSRMVVRQESSSQIGHLVQCIMNICTDEKIENELAPVFFEYLELLIDSSCEGKSQGLSILADYSQWLIENNKEWFYRMVFPYFDICRHESPAVWNGLFRHHHWHHIQDFALDLKPLFLKMIDNVGGIHSDINDSGVLVFLIEGCVFSENHDVVIEYSEVKGCLRKMSNDTREKFIRQLIIVGSKYSWDEHVIPFIKNAWPIEQDYKNSRLSKAWVGLLDDTGDDFPFVFSVLKNYLVPINSMNLNLYKFHSSLKSQEMPIAEKYADDSLEMLSLITSPETVNNSGVEQVLDVIIRSKPELEQDARFTKLKKFIAEQ
ncbi:MAG: SIR2 family protein [Oleispira sp.]|nr:SIR2 family protein [Oleispira sp.]